MWEEEETRLRCICPGRHAAALPAAGNWVVSGLFIPPAVRLPRLPAASSRADGTLAPDWQTSSWPAVSQLSSSSSSSSADDAVLSCLPAGLLSSRSADLFACSDGRVDFIERLKTLFFPPVVLIGAAKGAGSFSGKFFHGGCFHSRQWWEFTGKWRSWKRGKNLSYSASNISWHKRHPCKIMSLKTYFKQMILYWTIVLFVLP